MATTTWIAGSGDWNTASNWSNGVPTAAVDAVFPGTTGTGTGGPVTVTGDGPAVSISVSDAAGTITASTNYTLTGSHAAAMLTKNGPVSRLVLSGSNTLSGGLSVGYIGGVVELAGAGSGGMGPIRLSYGDTLIVDAGATTGPITSQQNSTVIAADASLTVFSTISDLTFLNGSGRSTVIGGTGYHQRLDSN